MACKVPECDRTDKLGQCFAHCQVAADAKHRPDWSTVAHARDAGDGIVDVSCALCGTSGSFTVTDKDVEWE